MVKQLILTAAIVAVSAPSAAPIDDYLLERRVDKMTRDQRDLMYDQQLLNSQKARGHDDWLQQEFIQQRQEDLYRDMRNLKFEMQMRPYNP